MALIVFLVVSAISFGIGQLYGIVVQIILGIPLGLVAGYFAGRLIGKQARREHRQFYAGLLTDAEYDAVIEAVRLRAIPVNEARWLVGSEPLPDDVAARIDDGELLMWYECPHCNDLVRRHPHFCADGLAELDHH